MKKILLLLTMFTFCAILAENPIKRNSSLLTTTTIPDVKFETYLETHKPDGTEVTIGDPLSMGDGSINQEVPTAKINAITNLNLIFLGINSLDGIEDFLALEQLTFQGLNNTLLTNLDLTSNSNLKLLWVTGFSNLANFSITGLANLETLYLWDSSVITSLDLISLTNLKYLEVKNYSAISNLNIINLTDLEELRLLQLPIIAGLDLSTLTGLKKIHLQELSTLSAIDFTNQSNLLEFSTVNLSITSLDLTPLIGLDQLILSKNSVLSFINLKTSSTSTISYVQLNGNPLLSCVEVDAGIPLTGMATWNQNNGSIFNQDCSNPETYVPDDNFEAHLEANSMGNGILNDDRVFTNNINTVTTLDVSSLSISDLTGIEDFIALVDLNATMNTISSVDVSQITTLENLILNNNALTTIDVSQNINLKQLWVRQNNISYLDVSQNIGLEWFICSGNTIKSLDLSANSLLSLIEIHTNDLHTLNLKNVSSTLSFFDARSNSNLTCIEVDDPNIWTTTFSTKIDGTARFSNNCNYPTTNVPDTAFENYLETHDRDGNTVVLGNTSSMGNGIANDAKVFTHRINTVKSLNVSNVGLTILTGLEDFSDLELFYAYGGNPSLTSVDVSSNLKLKRITVTFNLNVTNVTLGNLPDVTWVQFGYNNISNIDISGLPKLEHFNSISDKLTVLNTSNNPNLKILGLSGNQIKNLDVSNNLLLENLSVGNNQLTNLNVHSNTELKILNVTGNQLIALDVSNNAKLINFNTSNNQLSSLKIKNGNNAILPGTFGPGFGNFPFDIRNNPSLTCVEVSDVPYATTNWTAIDAGVTFNTTCANSLTYVPDDAFETYLENHDAQGNVVPMGDPTSMGNATSASDPIDNYVFTNRINTVKELNINTQNSGMVSLIGLEDFKDLEVFTTYPGEDAITSLDFSGNFKLKKIGITITSGNNLASIKLGALPDLTFFSLRGNNLVPTLDFSNSLFLERLTLENSLVSNLDFSSHTKLKIIQINGSLNLSSLNLANNFNTAITSISLNGNTNLSCIQVDNVGYSNTNWTNKDASATYSTDCSTVWTVMTNPTTTAALLAVSGLDADMDGEITLAEAAAFQGGLDLANSGITNVEGLQAFTSITILDISGNNITDLSPLNKLKIVESRINITTNDLLENLEGLNSLEDIGGYLFLWNNPLLNNINALTNVTEIGGYLYIDNNDKLINLQGLDNITIIGGDLGIFSNENLSDINSLQNLTSIGKRLIFENNPELLDFNLSSLTVISERLDIRFCPKITNLSSLSNLVCFFSVPVGYSQFFKC